MAHPQGSAIPGAPASKAHLLQQSAPSAHKAQPADAATDTAAQNRPDRDKKERRQAVGAEVGCFVLKSNAACCHDFQIKPRQRRHAVRAVMFVPMRCACTPNALCMHSCLLCQWPVHQAVETSPRSSVLLRKQTGKAESRATHCCMHACLMHRGQEAVTSVRAELGSCVALKTAVLYAIMTLNWEPAARIQPEERHMTMFIEVTVATCTLCLVRLTARLSDARNGLHWLQEAHLG